ncbi:TRL-like family protein [Oligoflexia bacterium]|nr:TRL-like family protein [Oligoflexia bacterium]
MLRLFFLLLLSFHLCSCVYLNVKSPLDKDVNNTVLGSKIGTSKTQSILWLVAWGDGGTAAAAKNGDITTISHLDVRYYSVLFGVYAIRETIAYGD